MTFKYHHNDTQILLICKRYELGRNIANVIYQWLMGDIRNHRKKMDQVLSCIKKLKNDLIDFEPYDGEDEDENDINYGELFQTGRNKKLLKHYLHHQGFDHLPIEIPGSKLPGNDSISFNKNFTSHEYFHGYVYTTRFANPNILIGKIQIQNELLEFKISYREAYEDHLKHYRSYRCPFCLLNETNGVELEKEKLERITI